MGNNETRPEHLTFNFEVDGAVITVNANKSSAAIQDGDLAIFNLNDKDRIMKGYFKTSYMTPYICSSNTGDYDFDWSGMSRILLPVNAKIVKQTNELVTVESTELKNTSSESGEFTYNANRSALMQETYQRKWFAETNVTSKVEIGCKILTLGTVEFSRKTTENVESEHIRTSSHSYRTGIKVTLEPNRSVRVDLQAIFHTVDVEVEYEASFDGKMIISYGAIKYLVILWTKYLAASPGVRATAAYKEIITVKYYTEHSVTMAAIDNV